MGYRIVNVFLKNIKHSILVKTLNLLLLFSFERKQSLSKLILYAEIWVLDSSMNFLGLSLVSFPLSISLWSNRFSFRGKGNLDGE